MLTKTAAAITVAALAVLGWAGVASAQTSTPSSEATGLFNSSFPQIVDLVKAMAPLVIGAGLTLLAIRKVVGAIRKGKAPSF